MSNYEYRAVGDDCDAEYSPSLGTSAQPLRSEPRLSFKTLLNKQKSILYPVINSLFCLFVGLLIGYYVGQHTTGSEAHNRHLLYCNHILIPLVEVEMSTDCVRSPSK
jgi:hypothetical protein